ncbi:MULTISPECIES: DUF979 domain-containing protein [Streptomycetaceae]|uniref:DUF979 domain-containing protein n=1 Tax=Streptantibioticus cattleyicolor (strain ATCC 35852 / DSM 46488 / JCM 4925 / NBRC 14057 / NRRL 8057) TaxID=1003195 RepID=F8K451_STREN|nr:DUF979 domain-containing protein [Streptantibioticus cattleyicolor]AEW92593.1 protein of unknown function DUF979 [Streptantibioticus cattleyicolor NRRL 8057 = DSM 46488]MYS57374.1 DUF979 family protein [Streptomyces sp. SID5468]CCB72947.1 putative membrane protein [Streptantibioticus cattleyicolor NRRL 8057 = DSM 46488]
MIKVEWFYWLVGAVFVAMAVQMAFDRTNPKRFGSAGFWGLLGLSFCYGTWVVKKSAPAEPLGAAVLVMICLAGFGLTGRGTPRTTTPEQRTASAARLGNRLFVPALTIPVVAVLCASLVKHWSIGGSHLLEPGSETILGLGFGAVAALVVGMVVVRERNPAVPLHAGRGLLESMGWALLLPQLLAVLGSIFQVAGVGTQVGKITEGVLPHGQRFVAVVVYCVGMAVFTIVMGNAFAAFPVMTAAIGWPVLIQQMHGNVPVVLAVGMLAGFCGTLVTPMAANFNLVPAALLELKDQYGPIKAQIPTAGALLVCNIAIIALFAF